MRPAFNGWFVARDTGAARDRAHLPAADTPPDPPFRSCTQTRRGGPESRPTQPDSPDAFETRTQAPRFVDLDTSNSPDTGPPNTTPLPAEKPPQLEIELSTGSDTASGETTTTSIAVPAGDDRYPDLPKPPADGDRARGEAALGYVNAHRAGSGGCGPGQGAGRCCWPAFLDARSKDQVPSGRSSRY